LYNTLMKKILSLFLLIFITACSQPKGMPYTLEFRDKGVGGLNAMTPFNEAKITASLLGFKLNSYTRFEAGVPKPMFLVRRADENILEIYPTQDKRYIERIESRSLHVKNKKNIKLGNVLQDSQECSPDAYYDNKLLCYISDNVAILYEQNSNKELIATMMVWIRHDRSL
ncbi:MAG: DUF1131 family protein, partial [Campylobacterota bacterium]|nr:DUF1131 family protein [Campylobacterota bacterium]